LKRQMLVAAIAVLIGVSGCVAVALAHASQPAAGSFTQSPLSDVDMKYFYWRIADLGIELKVIDGVPSVTEGMAIAIAKREVDGDTIAKDSERVTAVFTSLSDYSAGPDSAPQVLPGTIKVMKDVPVWIVTFHGVQILRSGPCIIDGSGKQTPSTADPYVFGDTSVVLDAETGEVLEGFSYSTPPAAQN
jgi:hypothetical protein